MSEARTTRRGRAPAPERNGRPEPGDEGGRWSRRWKAAGIALLVLGLLGAVAWVLLGSRLLVVRQVQATGTDLLPRDRVVSTAGIRLGLPMVRLDAGRVEARLEGLREVESATVERDWPATVSITVRERVPVVAVHRDGRYLRLDRHGVTVADGTARPAGMPTLSVASPGPTDAATLSALKVVGELPESLGKRLIAVEAPSPGTVTLRLRDGRTVIWGSAGRAQEKARLVRALRESAQGRPARTIDVSSPEVVTTR